MATRGGVDSFDPALFAAARKRAGLTQAEVAAKVLAATQPDSPAVGPSAALLRTDTRAATLRQATRDLENARLQVNDYENGDVVPRPRMLRTLADALGVDAFELLRPDTTVTLALARVRRGLLQSDLAPRLSISREQLSKVERGKATLSDDDRATLAAALDLTEAELAEAMSETATVADAVGKR